MLVLAWVAAIAGAGAAVWRGAHSPAVRLCLTAGVALVIGLLAVLLWREERPEP